MSDIPKILIVDDDTRMCDSLKALLSHKGYDLKTVNSAKGAIKCLEKKAFDLVLLDIVLGEENGYTVMDHIRRKNLDTLVVIITGHASIETAIVALRKGAYDFLRKPFEPEELFTTVKNALDNIKLKGEKDVLNGKLAWSEDRYRYLVQNSPDIIYTLDEKGDFLFVNRSIERLLNFRMGQLIGNHYTTVIYDEDTEKANWIFNERRTGHRATSGINLRLKICNDDDRSKHCEIKYITVELNSNGIYSKSPTEYDRQFLGTHGVARDITHRKNLEAQLQQAQKMKALSTLAGGIAHQFNNSLSPITISLDMLETHYPDDEIISHHTRLMKDASRRMVQLTNQLLAYALGGKYNVKVISMSDFVRDTLPLVKYTIDSSVSVKTDLPHDVFSVNADLTQLQMVLIAGLANASEAIEGKGNIRVSCKNERITDETAKAFPDLKPGDYVKLSIEDDGKGMDEETKSRLFEPFFTTKFQGRGLGMAAACGIIKNHDGWISVDSVVGRGTTVHVYLPAVEVLVKEPEKPKTEAIKGTGTILLVEDEEMVMDATWGLLERLGYRVLGAKTGQEAINIAKTFDGVIDLVILDLVLPDMGGKAIYPFLMKARPNLKVLVCSGYSLDGPAREILDAGAQGFIQKPFAIAEISEKMKEVLEGKEERTSNMEHRTLNIE